MKDVVPTLEELNRKSVTELGVIFRLASERAQNSGLSEGQRAIARQTMTVVLRALSPR